MKIKKIFKMKKLRIVLALVFLYLVLLVPDAPEKTMATAGKKPFRWNMNGLWMVLEHNFKEARAVNCNTLTPGISDRFSTINALLTGIEGTRRSSEDLFFYHLEREMFHLAPQIAACPQRLLEYIALCSRVRRVVKEQSIHWNMHLESSRDRIYRLLYGTRAALEEVLLQVPAGKVPKLTVVEDVPATTPAAKILGVTIHSGDILVSRGGASTSALIARGNDYPGNFSHIALVHVDGKTFQPSVIEAHIEKGVAISTLAEYLKDKKLRVMVLRLRGDLSALQKDLLLPHHAAQYALMAAQKKHIPYDFEMDYHHHDELFCSEVASSAYERFGVYLWQEKSSISSPGLASWLAAFGVTHAETHEPSDVEYDPQLKVVAEWRDNETLYQDHLDNAVIDVMLEGAEKGERLTYSWYMLPLARMMKAFSWLVNRFGLVGPIPEGMSATTALKSKTFTQKHQYLKNQLQQSAEVFKKKNGYTPPYWELLDMAKKLKKGSPSPEAPK